MIIYAAADTKYFLEHGIEFINSCVANENYCLVTIFRNFEDPEDKQDEIVENFIKTNADKLHPNAKKYLYKPEYFKDMYDVKIYDNKAYYASFRFIHLPYVMKNFPTEDFLVLDIDSIIKDKIPEVECDLGLYLRLDNETGADDYEKLGMKVAAGILYIPSLSLDIAEKLKEEILKYPARWFNDQHAILKVFIECEKNGKNIFDFSQLNWMDWEFKDETLIWTGKGQRKFSEKYLKEKSKWVNS